MDEIKIMPEYECSPIWISKNGQVFENVAIKFFNLNDELKKEVINWDNLYQSTLDSDYPPDSGFKNVKEEETFEKLGIVVWKKINEVYKSSYKVTYYSIKMDELLNNFPN